MAKKDKLKNLVNDFIGASEEKESAIQAQHPTIAQRRDLSQEEVALYDVTPEMEAKLNTIRRLKVGRPRGRKNGDSKEREARATFIVKPEVVQMVKYIALVETKLFKNVIDEALTLYVKQWEKKNGEIIIKNKKK